MMKCLVLVMLCMVASVVEGKHLRADARSSFSLRSDALSAVESSIDSVEQHLSHAVSLLANDTALHKAFATQLDKLNASKEVRDAVARAINQTQQGLANKTLADSSTLGKADTNKPSSFLKRDASKEKDVSLNKLQKEQQILKDLFAHLKGRISGLNKHEKEGKKEQEEMRNKMSQTLDSDRQKLEAARKNYANESFEVVRLVNRTRMDERELHYWNQIGVSEHGSFHANLKVTHSLMAHVKDVLQAYSQRMTKGAVDSTMMKKIKQISMPSAFLFIKRSLHLEVRDELAHRRLTEHLLNSSAH